MKLRALAKRVFERKKPTGRTRRLLKKIGRRKPEVEAGVRAKLEEKRIFEKMPWELREVTEIKQDKNGNKAFAFIEDGMQRYVIYFRREKQGIEIDKQKFEAIISIL